MKKIELAVSYHDERGEITDILENEEINAITQVTFKAGAVRGNHYHKKTVQYNYVINGSIELVTQKDDDDPVHLTLGPGELAVTHAMEKHAIRANEDSVLMVFTRGPRGGKEYESDTWRLEKPLV